MAKDSQRLEQEFLATLQEKTGKDLAVWLAVIRQSGQDKPNAIIKWLKETHGLNHAQANFLAGIYLNDGKPVFDYKLMLRTNPHPPAPSPSWRRGAEPA
jgi:hypothetical protein